MRIVKPDTFFFGLALKTAFLIVHSSKNVSTLYAKTILLAAQNFTEKKNKIKNSRGATVEEQTPKQREVVDRYLSLEYFPDVVCG